MAAPIRLRAQQIADLKTIAKLDIDTLRKIASHLQSLKPVPLQLKQLRAELLPLLASQKDLADAIIRQMLGLNALMDQQGLNLDELASALKGAVESARPRWTKEEVSAWNDRESTLRELLSVDAVRVISKVVDLSYEYANVLSTGRIITDIRPVFTPDAMAIEGAIISHKLFIRYWNVEGQKTFTITLDEDDVKALNKQCERALLKAKTISAGLSKGTVIRAIVPGQEENG